jgi:hypothetical protein
MTSVRYVDTGVVFKRRVDCFDCNEIFYFSLRQIAETETLICPQCNADINLCDTAYVALVAQTKKTIARIDELQSNSTAPHALRLVCSEGV